MDLTTLATPQALREVYRREQSRQRFRPDEMNALAAHPDPTVRAAMARACGRLGQHPEALLGLAADPDRSVRLAALEGIYVGRAVGAAYQSPRALDPGSPDPRFLDGTGPSAQRAWVAALAGGTPDTDPELGAAMVLAAAATGCWEIPVGGEQRTLQELVIAAPEPIRRAAYRGALLLGGDRLRNLPGRGKPLSDPDAHRAWLVQQAWSERSGPLAWWPVYLLAYGGTGGAAPARTSPPVDDWRGDLCALAMPMDGDGPAARYRRLFALRGLGTLRPGDDDRTVLLATLLDPDPILVVEAVRSLMAPWPDRGPNGEPRHGDLETVTALAQLALGGAAGPAPRLDPRSHAQREAARALGRCKRHRVLAGHVLERLLVWAVGEGRGHGQAWLQALAELRGTLPAVAVRWARVHEDPLVRAALARAAGSMDPGQGLTILSQLTLDTDVRVRTATLEALQSFPDHIRATWLLGLLAEERDLALREILPATAQAMGGALPDPTPILEILRMAFADSPGRELAEARRLTVAAAAELARGDDPDAPGHLPDWVTAAASSDPHLPVRQEAARWVVMDGGDVDPARLDPASACLDPEWVTPDPEWLADGAPAMGPAPRVRVHTEAGTLEITLHPEVAPTHCWSILQLAADGDYDDLPFHRVVPNFVIQGADFRGDGYGARAWHGGFLQDELSSVSYSAGAVGMPKTPTPDTGGGQFFVSTVPTPHLDGRYTVFGSITSGWAVAERIAEGAEITGCEVIFDGR